MPEGPELARSRDHLRRLIQGKRIRSFSINRDHGGSNGGRYANKDPEGMSGFLKQLQASEATVDSVDVKGKFMWWTLSFQNNVVWWLWCTYGMSGQWTTVKPDKHTAATVWVEAPDGGTQLAINFRDPRHFGTLKFVNEPKLMQRKLDSLGPDMLNEPPTYEEFLLRINKRASKTIVEVLMDQSCISGCGNYVKAEALYLAEISPHRTVDSLLVPREVKQLYEQIINVLKASYANDGATIRSYLNIDGTKGEMQSRFVVYGKKVDPFGHLVIKEETADGRTTHWVREVQH